MAMTGGTAKLVSSGTPPKWPDAVKLYVYYKQAQDIASNSSTVTLGMYVTTPNNWPIGKWTDHYGSYIGTATSGANCKEFDGTMPNFDGTHWLVENQSFKVTHNADGTKEVTIYWKWGVNSGWSGVMNKPSGSFKIQLNSIPRAATISGASSFIDTANPEIYYSNPAGNSVTKLEACISLDGSKDDVPYRDIPKNSTSYTFSLTEAEKNTLRAAASTSNSINVRFYVQTTIGSNVYRNYVVNTMYITNADPIVNASCVDVGSHSITLTGDASNRFIKGYNNLSVNCNASAQKGATLKTYSIVCGDKKLNTASGNFRNAENAKITFTVKDSRGNTTQVTQTKTMVNYFKPTFKVEIRQPTAKSPAHGFRITGTFFNGSFGAKSNTLKVQFKEAFQNNDYPAEWIDLTPTITGNSFEVPWYMILAGGYKDWYRLQVRVIDAIYGVAEDAVTSDDLLIRALPVYDWSKDDFAFHVPIYIDNACQIHYKDSAGDEHIAVSMNNQNQMFFGYGSRADSIGSSYFDGNQVYIRSNDNISCSASGTIGGNKAWTNTSDARLKTNIENIPDVYLDIWMELQPKAFEWLNYPDGRKYFGLIAQDVVEAFSKHGIDYKTVSFVEEMPEDLGSYLGITYESYNILTALALKKTINKLSTLEREIANIKSLMEV